MQNEWLVVFCEMCPGWVATSVKFGLLAIDCVVRVALAFCISAEEVEISLRHSSYVRACRIGFKLGDQ